MKAVCLKSCQKMLKLYCAILYKVYYGSEGITAEICSRRFPSGNIGQDFS